jgi:heme-degrading monooxygenase HmoA
MDVAEGRWASGRWQVKEGKVDEFIEGWRVWLRTVSRTFAGFRSARLLQSEGDPQRFTSIAEFEDDPSLKTWKNSESFRAGIEPLKALCDDFLGGDYDVAVSFYAPAAVGS